jgi:hypothetical protein
MLFLSLICIVFYASSGFLLDKMVFTYSLKEMWITVRSGTQTPFWIYITVLALPALYFYLSGKRIKINKIWIAIYMLLTLLSFFIFKKLPSDSEQYLVKTNKEHFFLRSIFSMFEKNNHNINDAVKEFRNYFPEHQFF